MYAADSNTDYSRERPITLSNRRILGWSLHFVGPQRASENIRPCNPHQSRQFLQQLHVLGQEIAHAELDLVNGDRKRHVVRPSGFQAADYSLADILQSLRLRRALRHTSGD